MNFVTNTNSYPLYGVDTSHTYVYNAAGLCAHADCGHELLHERPETRNRKLPVETPLRNGRRPTADTGSPLLRFRMSAAGFYYSTEQKPVPGSEAEGAANRLQTQDVHKCILGRAQPGFSRAATFALYCFGRKCFIEFFRR